MLCHSDFEDEIEIECSEYPDNNLYIGWSDNCADSADVTVTFVDMQVSGGCVQPAGMYERAYTLTDDCGNDTTVYQYLRLVDTTNPELTIPADYTIECDETIVYDDASATDNCDGNVLIGLRRRLCQAIAQARTKSSARSPQRTIVTTTRR